MSLPAISMHSHVTTSHPHALSCRYQPSPCTLMSLPAIPIHSHVATSHPHALSHHYQPSPCTLMSLPAIPIHSHVATSHPHALSHHYQPSPCTLMSLLAIPIHSHIATAPCTLMSLSYQPCIHVTHTLSCMHCAHWHGTDKQLGLAGGAILIIPPQILWSSGQEQECWPGAKRYCIMYNVK